MDQITNLIRSCDAFPLITSSKPFTRFRTATGKMVRVVLSLMIYNWEFSRCRGCWVVFTSSDTKMSTSATCSKLAPKARGRIRLEFCLKGVIQQSTKAGLNLQRFAFAKGGNAQANPEILQR